MKKKPEVRDFVIGTYPLNAYPDPWDFVVDKYDIIIIEVDRMNDYELNLRSTIVYRTYKVNDHALKAWHQEDARGLAFLPVKLFLML
jgi:hypothetical protein